MSKSAGVNKLFLAVTAAFTQSYTEQALELGSIVLLSERSVRKQLNKRAAELLGPIIDDYFKDGIAATNKIVPAHISRLADDIGLPFKYNKDLLLKYNDKFSVFSGFYDTQAKSLFKKREIDALKRTILSGKYANWSDKELATAIRNTINTTRNRSLVIARTETTRLQTAATDIYFQNPKIKKEYNKIWIAQPGARPTHMSYNGQLADEEGYFDGACGKILGPPPPCDPFNCRCKIELVKRSEK